ncbi:hypothetical protein BCCR75600_04711 [Burkholderia sola]|nr:hypothetical protein BCCR75588_04692 [Burkholderia cenocepacia]CAG2454008.1 hypothetical protein BCCR75600_04711 [Burkholderia cenocepacia]CAG2494700.1 hypothetical protein BCCR75718_04688 [Burkholderia cenocepacia]
MPPSFFVSAPPPDTVPDSVSPVAPCTVRPPTPRSTLLLTLSPAVPACSAPPVAVMVPVPSDALSLMIAVPPASVASCAVDAPLIVQLPLVTSR